ncbi:NAD(P)-dependent oxidoreductase [Octadecabacter sp. 1_MG-2023]|uniref:NAD-dependent epimerase/dehydratase family protein n=1 Tax=unclassified Octadecabacter TaxID=196158 RepID=UPI001C08AE54|nr:MULTISPECIES: NAD(P)-dependent oxidoreductase [unclassified Octadecabacter]MBU2994381.1 NAD(P)-dependent oxidoreductase [Octadecabacter sp. B2R22]MDO6734328.1 NAD(P)-dependent oxidoreductase [Octadecabacter sp. 1_MG-2023]
MAKLLKKIVLTGACGTLGMELRSTLASLADELLSVDIADAPAGLLENETFVQADCSKFDEVLPLMEGADIAVHFASIPDERPFEELLGPNYLSSYNVWEAGHRHGVRRVIYASSVHAVGMLENSAGIDVDADHAPDTFYGLAKCFTEDLGKLYWAKRGMESVHLRIFSCTKVPQNARALRTWLSFDDLRHLVERSITTQATGFTVVYGISNNDRAPVNNSKSTYLGYHPKDNAENWADSLLAAGVDVDPKDPAQLLIGGPFATVPLGESGVAGIKAMATDAPAPAPEAAPTNGKKLPSFLTKKGMNP